MKHEATGIESQLRIAAVTPTQTPPTLAAGHGVWFPDWVRAARGGRSLREFSTVTGCAVGQLSQFETGKSSNPEWSTILRIAEHSEGRCAKPKLEINVAASEQVGVLESAAEEWKSNNQDPYNINLAVSVALREVARCMAAEGAGEGAASAIRKRADLRLMPTNFANSSHRSASKPKAWKETRVAKIKPEWGHGNCA